MMLFSRGLLLPSFIAFLALTKLGCCLSDDDVETSSPSETIRTLNKILLNDSWCWVCVDETRHLGVQRVLVDGKLRAFVDVVKAPPRINEDNVHETSGLMYAAFTCKCVERIDELLRSVRTWFAETTVDYPVVVSRLTDVNRMVLKTICSLFYFVDVAPNVLSYDSDVLIALLSIDLHVNTLIGRLESTHRHDRDEYDRIVFQMINSIERFTISNCPLRDVAAVNRRRNRTSVAGLSEKIRYSIDEFDEFLENTGLSTVDFFVYNISDDWTERTTRPRDERFDGNSSEVVRTKAIEDDLKFNIIAHVLNRLAAVLEIREFCPKSEDIDIDGIFECQKSAFDSIMILIYRNTVNGLRKHGDKETDGKTSSYFDKSDVVSMEDLIETYERFEIKARLLRFPRDFVNHIGLVLRMLKEWRDFRTVYELNVIIRRIEAHLSVLMSNKKTYSAGENDVAIGFELHAFIEAILSIRFIEYFNRIYRLLGNGVDEYHGTPMRYPGAMNKTLRYAGTDICRSAAVLTLYARCFDIKTDVDGLPWNGDDVNVSSGKRAALPKHIVEKLKVKTVRAYSALAALAAEGKGTRTIDLVTYAQRYLGYNITYFPDTAEKIDRIFYHVTNLVDKYQSIECASPRYRDTVYDEYATAPRLLHTHHLDDPFVGDKIANTMTAYDKSAFDDLPDGKLVNDLQSVSRGPVLMFWRGALRTIDDISADVVRNVFHVTYIAKYVTLVLRWTEVIVSHGLIDYADCVLSAADGKEKKPDKTADALFGDNFLHTYDFPVHCSATFITVATTFVIPSVRRDHLTVLGLKIMLEQHLEQYDSKTDVTAVLEPNLSHCIKRLSALFEKLKKIWKLKVDDRVIVVPDNAAEKRKNENNGVTAVNNDVIGVSKDVIGASKDMTDVSNDKRGVKKFLKKINFWGKK